MTPLEHLVRDHEEGPDRHREHPYREWVRLVERVPEGSVAARTQEPPDADCSIHFHVFTERSFRQMLANARERIGLAFDLELLQSCGSEFLVVLRKT